MYLKLVLNFLVSVCLFQAATAQGLTPIGTWTEHFPYNNATDVIASANRIISSTPFGLLIVDEQENTIRRLNSFTGLSETGISAIGFEADQGILIIGYQSGNIDIVTKTGISNLDAIKRSNLYPSKNINSIYATNNSAYLCTAFGIVVLDLSKIEVRATYLPGENGAASPVNEICILRDTIFAATAEGLKYAGLQSGNLQDFRTWKNISETILSPGSYEEVVVLNNRLVSRKSDSVFIRSSNEWTLLYHSSNRINSIRAAGNKLLVNEIDDDAGVINILSESGLIENSITSSEYILNPQASIFRDNILWIADSIAGLSRQEESTFNSYLPSSINMIPTGKAVTDKGKVWFSSGAANFQNPTIFASIQSGIWENVTTGAVSTSLTTIAAGAVAYDINTQSLWLGSETDGLIQISSGNVATLYKEQSLISPNRFIPGAYSVSGLAFDQYQNLWITNSGADENLVVRKADGSVLKFAIPYLLPGNAVSAILVDDANQLWIIAPGIGLICYNYGNSLESTLDDQWRLFGTGIGEGNLPSPSVLSIAKDRDNIIWIGTSRGIGIIPCSQNIFGSNSCEVILPVVQQGNFNGYLLGDQQVTAIAVDGGNRKWAATRNGVWLLSADGERVITRFNEENSPLPSDSVENLIIEPISGEVFFQTANGLSSYRGTATEGRTGDNTTLVFPNPVPPGYTGSIAIRGLPANAIVKITELNGKLVHQIRANGGQATWNGKTSNGRNVSSGVYLVLVSTDGRTENLATKIVIIQQ